MKKYIKGIGFYVLLFAVIIFIFTLLNYQSGPKEISFSELVNYINKGSVTQLQIDENNQAIAVIKEGKGEKETTLVADIPDIEILYQHAGDQIGRHRGQLERLEHARHQKTRENCDGKRQ